MQSNKNWNATSNVNQSSPGCLVVYSSCISKLSKCLHYQRNVNPSSIALYKKFPQVIHATKSAAFCCIVI